MKAKLEKLWMIYKASGLLGLLRKLKKFFLKAEVDGAYQDWLKRKGPTSEDIADSKRALETLAYKPLISVIVPTYNTPPEFLTAAIDSVLAQVYENWELCVADDASTHPHVPL